MTQFLDLCVLSKKTILEIAGPTLTCALCVFVANGLHLSHKVLAESSLSLK